VLPNHPESGSVAAPLLVICSAAGALKAGRGANPRQGTRAVRGAAQGVAHQSGKASVEAIAGQHQTAATTGRSEGSSSSERPCIGEFRRAVGRGQAGGAAERRGWPDSARPGSFRSGLMQQQWQQRPVVASGCSLAATKAHTSWRRPAGQRARPQEGASGSLGRPATQGASQRRHIRPQT